MCHFFVYVTTSSEREAINLGRTAVEERLAACANVLGKCKSIYWWENSLQTDNENTLILKTVCEKLDHLINRLKEIHSYECPCIVALNIHQGNVEFLDWISRETSQNFRKEK